MYIVYVYFSVAVTFFFFFFFQAEDGIRDLTVTGVQTCALPISPFLRANELTGTDPDRLPEEKARGITIDLGFAELNLGGPNGEKFHIGIVDVPGHEDFVKNMVAGVGSIDLALLVVAADDGWMPQTEEHLQILIYLGVRRIVVALTKIDLVEAADVAEEKVRAQLRDTPFADAAIVRTSITTESGIEELK